MSNKETKGTKETLYLENQQLRARMDELEETLRTIRSGEVDALVVSGSEGEQIFTLKGALNAYRVMVEAMSDGAVTLAQDSRILYCNDYFAEMIGVPHDQVIGMLFADIVAAQDQSRFGKMLARSAKSNVRDELMLQAVDGKPVPAYLSMHPLPESEGGVIVVVVTDLAEVAAATEARSRLALIVESSDDAIISTTLEGVVQSWNRAAVKLFGYSVKEAIGQDVQSLIVPPGNIDEMMQKLEIVQRGEPTHHVETERQHKDGALIPVSVVASPIIDANGKVVGASVNIRDISERVLATKKIHDSEENFRAIFETVKDVIFILDSAGIFVTLSPSLKKITGFSPDEWVGKPFSQFVHPDDLAGTQELFQQVLAGKSFDNIESRILKKSGDYLHSEISVDSRKYKDVMQIFGISRDITERKQAEDALRASEARFKTMFEQAPLGIAQIDSLDGQIYEFNSRFAEIAGRSMEAMAHIDWLELTHPDDIQADLDNMALMNAGKINGFQMEKRYLHPDGTAVWIDMTISSLKVEDKNQPRHLCMIQDISERKTAEARIAYLNRVHAVLSGINALIVRVQDRDELFGEACRIAVEAGGFRMSMLCIVDRNTMKLDPVASAGKDEELLTMIKDRLSSSDAASNTMVGLAIREKQPVVSNDSLNDPRVAFGNKYADAGIRSLVILPLVVAGEAAGTISLYASEIDFFHEDEMKLLMELAGDIAFAIDHLDKQEKINYLAYYDALTGLANRTLFLERVAQYMRSAVGGGHKLALLLIDLERFKNINDSLGRTAGDALLKQVAEWLTRNAGDANLLAHIDADHFAMVLPEMRQDGELTRLIEKMSQDFLGHPFRLNDAVFRIAAKAGIALFPDDGADADILFKNAEAALKKAKASGDRYLFYTQKMTAAVAGKLTLENQLRQAIDNGEFVLHYQPKVNLASGKVTSAEALIRWNDPRTGLVPPGQFIPILEETGLIYEVGRWALRQAIADYLRWRSAGLPAVRIAVNVSPLQLRNPGFIAEIEGKIIVDPHAAEGLELEVTESLVMADVERNISILQAVRAMGITIAIDDFGTGFSSLSYLAKLPVTTLKIDRSFVIEMISGPEGLALVSTIINLAHAFKLKVVAEGVETEEQSHLLRLLECDEIQGFLFSKAVPCEEFETKFLTKPLPGDGP